MSKQTQDAKKTQNTINATPENKGVPGKGSRGRRSANPMKVLSKTMKLIFSFYPAQLVGIILCVIIGAALSTLPSVFLPG